MQQVDSLTPKKAPKKHVKSTEFKIYTREEVAKHNTRDDAWVIIKHKETGGVELWNCHSTMLWHTAATWLSRDRTPLMCTTSNQERNGCTT